jgi:hypothetical protein
MNILKPAAPRPKFDEKFLTEVIAHNSPLSGPTARALATAILAAMRSNLGSRGGRTTKARYGSEHYSRIAKLGGRPKAEKQEE